MDSQSFTELGLYLRQKRIKKKLSQVEVAKQLGYSSQFVANWERGISSPPLDVLKDIIDIYGINTKEFFATMTEIQQSYWQRHIFGKKVLKKG